MGNARTNSSVAISNKKFLTLLLLPSSGCQRSSAPSRAFAAKPKIPLSYEIFSSQNCSHQQSFAEKLRKTGFSPCGKIKYGLNAKFSFLPVSSYLFRKMRQRVLPCSFNKKFPNYFFSKGLGSLARSFQTSVSLVPVVEQMFENS